MVSKVKMVLIMLLLLLSLLLLILRQLNGFSEFAQTVDDLLALGSRLVVQMVS